MTDNRVFLVFIGAVSRKGRGGEDSKRPWANEGVREEVPPRNRSGPETAKVL